MPRRGIGCHERMADVFLSPGQITLAVPMAPVPILLKTKLIKSLRCLGFPSNHEQSEVIRACVARPCCVTLIVMIGANMDDRPYTGQQNLISLRDRSRKIKSYMDVCWSRLNGYDRDFLIAMLSRIDTDDCARVTARQWRYLDSIEARLSLMCRYHHE